MSSRTMLIFVSISGFVYVAMGAFGVHVLNQFLGGAEMEWIKTGLRYQAFHTLAILGLSVAMSRRANIWFYWSSAALALGIVLFSGSLYGMALSNLRLWIFITPVGGTFFLIGWALMFVGALRIKNRRERDE